MGAMKVGVIAAEMEEHATGVGRYLGGLLRGLDQWEHGIEWHLFFQGEPSPSLPDPYGSVHTHFSHNDGSRVLWEQLLVSRALKSIAPDVVFGPAYSLPFGLEVPSVVTIHDLSFEHLPEDFRSRERWRRRLLARRAAAVARRVVTDTAFMSSMVSDRYGVDGDRLAVVPLGVDRERFSPDGAETDQRVLADLGVRKPYILVPGTVLERRLPRQVLGAFANVRRAYAEIELVMVGANRMRRQRDLDRWIGELGLEGVVKHLGWVAEKDLAPLYRGAEMAIYVSRHEGFGLPPLESLACGTPVVVSAGLGLDDAWPSYPFRVDRLDAESIAAVATAILADRHEMVRVMGEAGRVISGLNWERSSRQLVAELARAAST
jgi:glycosyltransferase involved in cell wall biosynthesis